MVDNIAIENNMCFGFLCFVLNWRKRSFLDSTINVKAHTAQNLIANGFVISITARQTWPDLGLWLCTYGAVHFEVVLEFWYLVLHIFIKVTSSPLLLHIRYTIVSYVLIMSFDQESNIVKMKPLRVNIKKMKFEPKTLSENTSKEIIVISDDEEDCLDTNEIHLHLNLGKRKNNNNSLSTDLQHGHEDGGTEERGQLCSEDESHDDPKPNLIFQIWRRETSDSPPSQAQTDSSPELSTEDSNLLSSPRNEVDLNETDSSSTQELSDFKKERKALLQRLRQQEITSIKKDLREMLPEEVRNKTRLEASALASSLTTFCRQLQSKVGYIRHL